MAGTREILSRMNSIKDTMKITNAMYMISSSKLKRARQKLLDTEPYFYTMQQALGRVLRHMPDAESRYLDTRPDIRPEDRKIGYIVVTADKGLAGAYNHNVFKLVQEQLEKSGRPVLFVVGDLGRQYFEKKGIPVETDFRYTVQKPNMSRARIIEEKVVDYFLSGQLDEVYLVYTRMVNAMKMEPELQKLLPLQRPESIRVPADVHQEDIVMMPSPEAVLESITPNCVAGIIFGGLVESYSSEQNSRMMAMQAATDSAKDMLKQLSTEYNRVRQAAITQEITEVISGARAQKQKQS